MTDTTSILKERLVKAEAKVSRYEKTLETAKNDLNDIRTTLKVLGQIEGESSSESVPSKPTPVGGRQLDILSILSDGSQNSQQPVDLYETYKLIGRDEINIDTFRTTVWRMKDKSFVMAGEEWVVCSDNGRYWKESNAVQENEAPEAIATDASETGGWGVAAPQPPESSTQTWPTS